MFKSISSQTSQPIPSAPQGNLNGPASNQPMRFADAFIIHKSAVNEIQLKTSTFESVSTNYTELTQKYDAAIDDEYLRLYDLNDSAKKSNDLVEEYNAAVHDLLNVNINPNSNKFKEAIEQSQSPLPIGPDINILTPWFKKEKAFKVCENKLVIRKAEIQEKEEKLKSIRCSIGKIVPNIETAGIILENAKNELAKLINEHNAFSSNAASSIGINYQISIAIQKIAASDFFISDQTVQRIKKHIETAELSSDGAKKHLEHTEKILAQKKAQLNTTQDELDKIRKKPNLTPNDYEEFDRKDKFLSTQKIKSFQTEINQLVEAVCNANTKVEFFKRSCSEFEIKLRKEKERREQLEKILNDANSAVENRKKELQHAL